MNMLGDENKKYVDGLSTYSIQALHEEYRTIDGALNNIPPEYRIRNFSECVIVREYVLRLIFIKRLEPWFVQKLNADCWSVIAKFL